MYLMICSANTGICTRVNIILYTSTTTLLLHPLPLASWAVVHSWSYCQKWKRIGSCTASAASSWPEQCWAQWLCFIQDTLPKNGTRLKIFIFMNHRKGVHFAVEHRFGCHTTEPCYAGDISTIEVWSIDWSHLYMLTVQKYLHLVPFSLVYEVFKS